MPNRRFIAAAPQGSLPPGAAGPAPPRCPPAGVIGTWTRTGPEGTTTRTRAPGAASGIGVTSTSMSAVSPSSEMVPAVGRGWGGPPRAGAGFDATGRGRFDPEDIGTGLRRFDGTGGRRFDPEDIGTGLRRFDGPGRRRFDPED
ncbi:MAG: hypothetical protein ACE5JH_12100, partial [Acidobacteriota bacterium]